MEPPIQMWSAKRKALAGAAVAAMAVVGILCALWLSGGKPYDGERPAPATEPAHPGNLREPMHWRPSWLPEGVVEVSRQATIHGVTQSRVWMSQAALGLYRKGKMEQAAHEAQIDLMIGTKPDLFPTTPFNVPISPGVKPQPGQLFEVVPSPTIDGRRLKITGTGNMEAEASWRLSDDGDFANLLVHGLPDALVVVERIARSIVPDRVTGCETSLRFGWLPPGMDPAALEISVSGIRPGWSQMLDIGSTAKDPNVIPRHVIARLAPTRDLIGVELSARDADATIRGREGTLGSHGSYGQAVVQLANGQWLAILCYVGESDQEFRDSALRIANELIIGPDPSLDWIGQP